MKNNYNILTDFLSYLEENSYKRTTIDNYNFSLEDFFKYLKTVNVNCADFNNDNVLDYIKKLTSINAVQTINSKIYSILKYTEYLNKYKNAKIELYIKPIKSINKKSIKPINDINIILNYIDKSTTNEFIHLRDRILIGMIYYSGSRVKDIIKMRVCDVSENEITINDQKITVIHDLIIEIKEFVTKLNITNENYLFFNFSPGQNNKLKTGHLTEKSVQDIFNRYKIIVDKNLSIRDLRSSLEANIESDINSVEIKSIFNYFECSTNVDYFSFKSKLNYGK